MSYQLKVGIDYLVDLYQVVDVDPESRPEEIKSAIRARMLECGWQNAFKVD